MKDEEKDQETETLPSEESPEVSEIEAANNQEEIANLQNQITALEDKLLRAAAESENLRRRYEKMIEETRDYSLLNFAKDLLGVMDNLSRALEHKPQELDSQMSGIFAGVEMTKNELLLIFKKHGLEAIEPQVGEKFDYNLHHAISQIVTDDYEQDSIMNVMQMGYKIKNRLLRPAAVVVAKKAM